MSEQGRKLAKKLGVVPKLRLAVREVVEGQLDKSGNPKVVIKSTGPHRVKLVSEPALVFGADPDTGAKRQEQQFIVEENGQEYRWQWPIMNKENKPSYLVERTMDLEVGEEFILESLRRGARNYTDVRKVDEEPDEEVPLEEGHVTDEMEAQIIAESDHSGAVSTEHKVP